MTNNINYDLTAQRHQKRYKKNEWRMSEERQAAVLDAIRRLQEAQGYAPTIKEIADELGWIKATAQQALDFLRKNNRVTWEPRKARTLKVL